MEKIQYCNCFHLNNFDNPGEHIEQQVNQIKASLYLTDVNDGLFLLDSPYLYIISKDYFFSVQQDAKGQSVEIKKHFQVDQVCISFVVNSGKVYLLYKDKIVIFMLHVQEPPRRVVSTKVMLGMVLIESQVFVCTEDEIRVLINDQMLMTRYSSFNRITMIKPGPRNTDVILVEFDNGFEVLRIENENNMETVFQIENLSEFQVEFLNKAMLLIFYYPQKTISIIEWTQSEDPNYTLDLQDYQNFHIKTRKNIILLTDSDTGMLSLMFYNKHTNSFLLFKGSVDSPISHLDFDYDYSDFSDICKLKGLFSLNFYFSHNDSIHSFCLNLDLMQEFLLVFTLQTHKLTSLKNPPVLANKPQELAQSHFKLVPEVPKFEYPNKIEIKPMANQGINPEYGPDTDEFFDRLSDVQSVFLTEKLGSFFTQAFLKAKSEPPLNTVKKVTVFDSGPMEKVEKAALEIQRFLSR